MPDGTKNLFPSAESLEDYIREKAKKRAKKRGDGGPNIKEEEEGGLFGGALTGFWGGETDGTNKERKKFRDKERKLSKMNFGQFLSASLVFGGFSGVFFSSKTNEWTDFGPDEKSRWHPQELQEKQIMTVQIDVREGLMLFYVDNVLVQKSKPKFFETMETHRGGRSSTTTSSSSKGIGGKNRTTITKFYPIIDLGIGHVKSLTVFPPGERPVFPSIIHRELSEQDSVPNADTMGPEMGGKAAASTTFGGVPSRVFPKCSRTTESRDLSNWLSRPICSRWSELACGLTLSLSNRECTVSKKMGDLGTLIPADTTKQGGRLAKNSVLRKKIEVGLSPEQFSWVLGDGVLPIIRSPTAR